MAVTSVPFSSVNSGKAAEAVSSEDDESSSLYTYEKLGSVEFDRATPPPDESPEAGEEARDTGEDAESSDAEEEETEGDEEASDEEAAEELSSDDGYDYYVRYKKEAFNGENVKLQFVRTGLGEGIESDESNVEFIDQDDELIALPNITMQNGGTTLYASGSYYGHEKTFSYSNFVSGRYGNYEAPSGDESYEVSIGSFTVSGRFYDEYKENYYGERGGYTSFNEFLPAENITLDINWLSPVSFAESASNPSTKIVNAYSATVYAPEYETDSDYSGDSLDYSFEWQQLNDDDQKDKWTAIGTENSYTAYSSKTVRCEVDVETSNGYPVDSYISDEYEISIAKSYPVRFSDGDGSFSKNVTRYLYVKDTSSNIELKPGALVSDGYDVTYQWSVMDIDPSSDTYGEFVDIDKADKENYTVKDPDFTYEDEDGEEYSIDTLEYRVTAKATLKGDEDVVYEAESTFMLTKKPYLFENDPENWSDNSQEYYLSASVGETVKASIPIKSFAYDLSYQWYQVEPEYAGNDLSYSVRSDILNDENEGETYTELSKATSASFSYKMNSDDFGYTDDDGEYHHVPANFVCKVTAEDEDTDESESELFYLTVNEQWNLKSIYDKNESESSITTESGEKAEITAVKYSVANGYKVSYEWSLYDDDPDSDTYEEYVDLDKSGRTLRTEAYENTFESGENDIYRYRCTVSVTRKGEDDVLYSTSKNYTVYVEPEEYETAALKIERKTPSYQLKQLGSEVSFGVTAKVNNDSYKISYKWTRNGKDLNFTKDTYKIGKCKVTDYGSYVCTITAENENDSDDTIVRTVNFTLEEDTGLKLVSPAYTAVNDKKSGDRVNFTVKAVSDTDSRLSYRWYRRINDKYAESGDDYSLIEGEDGDTLSLKLSDNDFTSYKVIVSDSHSTVSAYYYVNSKKYGAYSEIEGTAGTTRRYYKEFDDPLTLKINAGSTNNDVTFSYEWKRNIVTGYYYEERTIDGADKNSLTLRGGDESEFGTYKVEITGKNDVGDEVYNGTIWFYVNETTNDTVDRFKEIREYGEGAYNRTGDKVRFGIEHTDGDGDFTYGWTFAREYEKENGKTYFDTQYPEVLSEKSSVISYDSLSENQFGIYTLTVKNKEDDSVFGTYSFTLRKYDEIGLTAYAKGDYNSYRRVPGENVTFNVEAETDTGEDIYYQWYYGSGEDSQAIYDETGKSLTLKDLKRGDFGSYSCRVTAGNDTTEVTFYVYRTGNLKVNDDTLYSDTKYIHRNIGEKAVFSVDASSDKEYPVTYTWYRNNKIIEGQTSSDLTVSGISRKDFGTYKVEINNGVDSEVSRYFVLSLPDDYYLRFVENDADAGEENGNVQKYVHNVYRTATREAASSLDIGAYVDEKGSVTVNAEAETSEGYTITYKWQKYDDVQERWLDIKGADSADYIIRNADFDDSYRCVVGTEASDFEEQSGLIYAYVTLYDINELRGLSITADRDYAIEGKNVTFTADIDNPSEGISYEYQWYTYDEDGNVVKIKGANSKTYTVSAPSPDSEDSLKNNGTLAELKYWCRVTGGEEESEESYTDSISIDEIVNASISDALPQSLIFDGSSVKGYTVKNADEVRIVFDKAYTLTGFGTLTLIDQNGNIVRSYPDEDGKDAAGQNITVPGNLVYFYFDTDSSEYSNVSAGALAWILENGSTKLGYKVSRMGAKTVLDAEDEAQAKAEKEAEDAKAAAEADALAKDNARRNYVDNLMKTASLAAISSKGGVTNGLLTVNKKKIVVAPGKTVQIGYKAVVASGNSIQNVTKCTAVSKNEKLCTVTVPDTQFINISVPANATKGASAKVVVSHGTDKVSVKVYVRNKAVRVKPAKKKAAANKGKSFSVTLRVTAENRKKAVTDKVKVSNLRKLAKVKKIKVSRGKAVINLKANKKSGSTRMIVKVGKASTRVKLSVGKVRKKTGKKISKKSRNK